MPKPATGLCKSCLAPVFWCLTKNEKPMPVNMTPVLNGNLVLEGDHVNYVKPDPSVPRFVSHHATCVNAEQHRREKAAKKAEGQAGGGE